MRSWKISNVGRSLDGWPKIYHLEFLVVSEGTLSRWSRLHLQTLAPTNHHWARVVGYGFFSLCVIHKGGLCPSSGDINRLMMMMMMKWGRYNMFFIMWWRFGNYFYDQPPAWRQPSLKLKLIPTTPNAAGTNGLTSLPKHGGARGNKIFGHPTNERPTLLNFRNRTPKRTDRETIELR
jgi:hypothetical protein